MKGVRPTLILGFLWSLKRPFQPRAAAVRYQEAALRRLVRHAYANVPFYRRRWGRDGVVPDRIRTLADLAELPAIARRELQEAPLQDRLAAGVALARCHRYETSGSSGEPLSVVRTPHEDARIFGRRLRAQVLSGLRPWDLRVNIGSPRRIFRWHRVGAFRILTVGNPPPHDQLTARVAALAPDVLMVTPESLELLIEQAAAGPPLRPRLIFTGANQLRPSVRRRAQETFGTPLVDFYGTTECSLVAWECTRCGRYHSSDDSVIVELVREDGHPAGPGESGEVVLTVLHSRAMPFVRLRLGDTARRPPEPRPCPIHFDALEHVEGRLIDYLRFPGGRQLSPFRVLYAIDSLEGLGRFQLTQQSGARLELRYEALSGAAPETVGRAIETRLREHLPADIELMVRHSSFAAERGNTAKHRVVRALASDASPSE